MCLIYTYLGCYAAMSVRKKVRDVNELREHLMQTWFDFEQDIINAAIDQRRDRLRSCVRADGGHFAHLL